LTLLVTRIGADNSHDPFTPNNFTVAAHFFDRSRNSHRILLINPFDHLMAGYIHLPTPLPDLRELPVQLHGRLAIIFRKLNFQI
jgi:hypothetical protein